MADSKSPNAGSAGKKRNPGFVVKESKFSARVKSRWRFPRGKHSAVRQMHKGRPPMPTPGYGAAKKVKGLRMGLQPLLVARVSQLEGIDTSIQGVVISGKVGNKKRLEILQAAEEKKIFVLNVKDTGILINTIKEKFAARKRAKNIKLKDKDKKEEEKKKKAIEKKKKEEEDKSKKEKENNSKNDTQDKDVQGTVEDKLQAEEKKIEEEKKIAHKTFTKRQ